MIFSSVTARGNQVFSFALSLVRLSSRWLSLVRTNKQISKRGLEKAGNLLYSSSWIKKYGWMTASSNVKVRGLASFFWTLIEKLNTIWAKSILKRPVTATLRKFSNWSMWYMPIFFRQQTPSSSNSNYSSLLTLIRLFLR